MAARGWMLPLLPLPLLLLSAPGAAAERGADRGTYTIQLTASSSSTAGPSPSRWWKETETDRVVINGVESRGVCLDTSFAAAVAAQSCDSAGSGPSAQRLAWWANDSSIRWLPVSSPGHAPQPPTCLWQVGSARSATMRPCGPATPVTDPSGQWQWDAPPQGGALKNASAAAPIVNRRSHQHLQLAKAPAPAPGPRPPPRPNPGRIWPANWNLTASYGMNYIEPSRAVRFAANQTFITLSRPQALVGLDWTVSVGEWFTKPGGANHTKCEAVSRENCRRIKASGMVQRCCIYHNTELALGWLESQAKAMDDPSKADYFLQYPNGTIYSEDIVFGRQWFWNHTNQEASDYFVSSMVESLQGSDADCTFTDDVQGLPEEHPAVTGKLGMSPQQLEQLQRATALSYDKLLVALVAAGKYDWQAFAPTPRFSNGSCSSWMDRYCEAGRQRDMMIMAFDNAHGIAAATNASIAAFLITRPPIGIMQTDTHQPAPAAFLLQPGTPVGLCKKEGQGVYSREWTNGVARLDCGSFSGALPFPTL